MADPLCIYHGNCADGFTAAWAVRRALGDRVEFHPGVYQQDPPDVAGRDVIMVDFSYKRPVLEAMIARAHTLLVLDHHKSALEDLHDLPPAPESWAEWEEGAVGAARDEGPAIAAALFNMERSGAGIAWDFFHDAPRPALLDHVEDRDLWRFALPHTREIQAALFSYPYDFRVWDEQMARDVAELAAEGAAIERKHHKDIAELVAVCRRRMVIGGHDVPVASLPYTLTSDAGHLMAQGEPFAACYWDTSEARIFSLRSTDDGEDVSAIAVQYGGGGHRNAAGFKVPRDHRLART